MDAIGDVKMSNELEEIRREAHDNTWLNMERAKIFHDKSINREEFSSRQKVLLHDLILHIFLESLGPGGPVLFLW